LLENAKKDFLIAMYGGAIAGSVLTYLLYTEHLGVKLTPLQLGLLFGLPVALVSYYPIRYALFPPKAQ
jgi:hypothetical protein